MRNAALCYSICLAILGCSGQDDARSGSAQRGSGVGQAGAAAQGASGTGSFGNSDGGVTQQGPLQPATDAGAAPGQGGGSEPITIDHCAAGNPAGLSDADVQKLKAGGAAGVRMLYPYDGTVLPRGMISPTLMWEGAGDFVYVHVKSKAFEYFGCLKPTGAGQLQLPQDVWDAATARTYGPSDPYGFEINVMTGGSSIGPARLQLVIAQATIKGSIYYNSYSSKLAASFGLGAGQGAVLRIPGGKTAEVFLNTSGCNACHSVSADGSRMISLPLGASLIGPANSSSYALTPGGAANPAAISTALANAAFPGLSPDGKLYATSAHQGGVGPRPGSPVTTGGPTASLYETDTAAEVAGSGLPSTAMTPMFSPEGRAIAFTDYAIGNGHGLAVMSFDPAQRKASGYSKVYETGDARRFPAWPFYLPDGKALVFAIGSTADFSGAGAGLMGAPGGAGAASSDLYVLDLASRKATLLARAMGFATEADAGSGKTYLPFGAAELHHHYYPTVAPVAAGGYFWVFFDSLRHYGNQGLQRQIWGAAIAISGSGDYSADRSHPAFYLPGQEPNTGNHRAFAALDPCKQDGADCTTGIDCCGGTCYVSEDPNSEFMVDRRGTCMEPPEKQCARTDEGCVTDADCCLPEGNAAPNTCIAGFCAQILLE